MFPDLFLLINIWYEYVLSDTHSPSEGVLFVRLFPFCWHKKKKDGFPYIDILPENNWSCQIPLTSIRTSDLEKYVFYYYKILKPKIVDITFFLLTRNLIWQVQDVTYWRDIKGHISSENNHYETPSLPYPYRKSDIFLLTPFFRILSILVRLETR